MPLSFPLSFKSKKRQYRKVILGARKKTAQQSHISMTKLSENINKIGELKIPFKYILAFIAILLICLYSYKETELFEKLLMLIIPFLIGTSVKVAYILFGAVV